MALRLMSKTGCLTCLVRKKKCDELKPRCGHCERLGLTCMPRNPSSDSVKNLPRPTNLKAKASLQKTISNGYPSFRSEFEKRTSRESPSIFSSMISRGGGPAFFQIDLLGRFCTQNLLVREAVTAFAAFTSGEVRDSYKTTLTHYQSCIVRLRHLHPHKLRERSEQDLVTTTLVFLGVLEALNFGDPQICIAHLKLCKKLLVDRLADPEYPLDADLTTIIRIATECIVFNLGTLTQFLPDIEWVCEDWGHSFGRLFPPNDPTTSPFLGGMHEIYDIMLKLNILSRQSRIDPLRQTDINSADMSYDAIWSQLDQMDIKITSAYPESLDECQDTNELYRKKHRMFVRALRIHLIKIFRPDAQPSDSDIRLNVAEAIAIFEDQDLREPPNPSVRWPMTIIACAVHNDDDFAFLTHVMLKVSRTIGRANQEKLEMAFETLRRFRTGGDWAIQSSLDDTPAIVNSLDFLLQPWKLLSLDGTAETHSYLRPDVEVVNTRSRVREVA